MKLPLSFVTTRDGVNAARALFEQAGWIVQSVDQQNDFGKDAYVDITKSGLVTPLCIAVQIKSGVSYRSSAGDYAVPVEGHATIWRRSSVPVFGIIYDPDDRLLRWTDLTRHLRDHPEQDSGSISVARSALLNEMTLQREFYAAALRYAVPEKDNADT